MFRLLIILATIFWSNFLLATLPDYNPAEILARANINDGFNLPPMSFLDNTSPVINNNGDIAFKVMAVEGVNNQALWVKSSKEKSGKIIYTAPDARFITDPSINDTGYIAFNLFDEGVTDGLFLFEMQTQKVEQVLDPVNLKIQHYTYPLVQDNNHIFFRATNDSNDRLIYEYTGSKLLKIIAEGTDTLGLKASYLFKPAANLQGQVAFKARFGEKGQWDENNPDSIVLWSPNILAGPKGQESKYQLIAVDRDVDQKSDFISFGNSVSLSHNGYISFMATLADSKKAIVLFKDNQLKTIAKEGENQIFELEMFSSKVNDSGKILFRAKDMNGNRGLYLADENQIKKIIGEGDVVMTDLGEGKILSNPNYPGFGGEIDFNDKGDIVFYCIVVNAQDNSEYGSAIFKVSPKN